MRKLLTALVIAVWVSAQAVTIEECRQMARDNYPLTKSYGILDLTEQYTLATASKAWLPQIQLGAQATWQNNVASYPDALLNVLAMQGIDAKGLRKDQYRIGAEVQQTVWDGGRIGASKNTVRRQTDEQRRSNDVELYALEQRVDELYFGILLLKEQSKAVEAGIELIDSNIKKMESMLRNGVAMQADMDALKAERLYAEQQQANIEAAESNYRRVLALYIGEIDCPELEMPKSPAACDGIRPEHSLFDAKLATLKAKEEEVKASLRPSISLFGSTFYGYPGFNSMEAMINHKWTFNIQVGARIAWNISPFYSKKSKLSQISAQSQYIENQRKIFEFNNALQEVGQRGEIARLQRIASNDSEIVALRKRVRVAEEAKLREGVINSTQLLQKITDERNAMITEATHIIEILRAEYKLTHTIGK